MKKKEKESLRSMTVEELTKEIDAIHKKLALLSVTKVTKPTKNTRETRMFRKKLATMLTFQRDKELITSLKSA